MILPDTDVCVEILLGNENVINKRLSCDEQIAISYMTVGELYYGAERSGFRIRNISRVEQFMLSLSIINTDVEIMKKFGEYKSYLKENNILLPDADILIASAASTKCSKLITGNTKHFQRFENLLIENWIK